jgi:acetyl-CoA carboxylase biotin carboxyl carrier protein
LKSAHNHITFTPADDIGIRQRREAVEEEDVLLIKSLMVGTFFSAPSPDGPNYAEVNSEVDSSTVVYIIEAIKVMNEIQAEKWSDR